MVIHLIIFLIPFFAGGGGGGGGEEGSQRIKASIGHGWATSVYTDKAKNFKTS